MNTSLKTGDILDKKYEILSEIGEGGTGTVYKARPLQLHYDVAAKVLARTDAAAVERFNAATRSLGQVSHPAIVRVSNIGDTSQGGRYAILAYVSGPTVAEEASQNISVSRAVDLALAIAAGITACHIRSVIHCDLKPSGVRVTEDESWQGCVKILDLGHALQLDGNNRVISPSGTSLVEMVRVHPYLAPELLRREQATKQCDQYGIAALLYLLLTGCDAFRDLEGDALARAILDGDYVDPGLLRDEIPDDLRAILARGLHTDPSQRFPSVGDFANAILPWASPGVIGRFTEYFKPNRPINRTLWEPVSQKRSVPQKSITPRNVVPLVVDPIPVPEAGPPISRAPLVSVPAPAAPNPAREAAPSRAQANSTPVCEPLPSRVRADPLPAREPAVLRWHIPDRKEEAASPPVDAPIEERRVSSRRRSSQEPSKTTPPATFSFAILPFVLGTILGASITTALFMGYLLQKYLPPSPTAGLAAPQPQAEVVLPAPPVPAPQPEAFVPPRPESAPEPKVEASAPQTVQESAPTNARPQPSPSTLLASARSNIERDNLPRALHLARQAAAHGGGAPAYVLVGRVLAAQHNHTGAVTAFKRALRLDPKNTEAASRLERLRLGTPSSSR